MFKEVFSGVTDAAGKVALANLPTSTLNGIGARHHEKGMAYNVSLGENARVEMGLNTIRVKGKVTDAATGAPLRGILASSPESWALTDANGEYQLDIIGLRTFADQPVLFQDPNQPQKYAADLGGPIDPVQDQIHAVDIQLEPGRLVRGKVLNVYATTCPSPDSLDRTNQDVPGPMWHRVQATRAWAEPVYVSYWGAITTWQVRPQNEEESPNSAPLTPAVLRTAATTAVAATRITMART
jgi:hypothetical protein